MPDAERYPFTAVSNASEQASLMPWLTVSLTYGNHSVSESGLLDTGAAVNVLPFQTGITWARHGMNQRELFIWVEIWLAILQSHWLSHVLLENLLQCVWRLHGRRLRECL